MDFTTDVHALLNWLITHGVFILADLGEIGGTFSHGVRPAKPFIGPAPKTIIYIVLGGSGAAYVPRVQMCPCLSY